MVTAKRVTGPIQVLLIGFDRGDRFSGQILAELRRVRKRGVIRIVDLLFVQKDRGGNVQSAMHMTDLSERERQRLGAIAGGLLGLQIDGLEGAAAGAAMGAMAVAERDHGLSADQLRELAEQIPAGGAGAVLVIEHHWAARLREAVGEAGGRLLAQALVGPDVLVMVGRELEAKLEAAEAIEAAEEIKAMAALEAARALAAAELIKEASVAEAAEVVATAIAIEAAATAEAAATVAAAADVEASAVDRAVNALIAADMIEAVAVDEASRVVAGAIAVEEAATDEAAATVAAAEEVKREAALEAVRALIAAEVIETAAAEEVVQTLVGAGIVEAAAAEEARAAILGASSSRS